MIRTVAIWLRCLLWSNAHSTVFPLSAPSHSTRLRKGKAVVDYAPRGKKRSAATASRMEDEGVDMGVVTPPEGHAPDGHPTYKVVVQSPPSSRPRQRLRMTEDVEASKAAELSKAASPVPPTQAGLRDGMSAASTQSIPLMTNKLTAPSQNHPPAVDFSVAVTRPSAGRKRGPKTADLLPRIETLETIVISQQGQLSDLAKTPQKLTELSGSMKQVNTMLGAVLNHLGMGVSFPDASTAVIRPLSTTPSLVSGVVPAMAGLTVHGPPSIGSSAHSVCAPSVASSANSMCAPSSAASSANSRRAPSGTSSVHSRRAPSAASSARSNTGSRHSGELSISFP